MPRQNLVPFAAASYVRLFFILLLALCAFFSRPALADDRENEATKEAARQENEGLVEYPTARQRVTPLSAAARNAIDAALERARSENLGYDVGWKRILFITPGWFSSSTSIVDSPDFYFAPRGKKHPDEELAATLEALYHGENDYAASDVHPQCRYPARTAFLKSRLSLDPATLPQPRCGRYEAWRKNASADAVSLVFSSYYLNNPSSMFGHTFLRLHRVAPDGTRHNSLLDWSVNYAAFPTTTNPLLYTVMGLSGGFPGAFSMLPHFVKVQEYNDAEARDLWEYELDIPPEGVQAMLRSLWEIGDHRIDYYYFDDNCAYILLALLDVADPRLDLSSHFYFWVTPSDAVRVAARVPNLVRAVQYRPSNRSRFAERWDALSDDERRVVRAFLDILEEPLAPGTLPSFPFDGSWKSRAVGSRARVLDAVLEWFDFRIKASDKERQSLRPLLLKERAAAAVPSPALVRRPDNDRPDAGHSSNRVGLSGGVRQARGARNARSGFAQFEWRPSLHDIMAPGVGYPPGLQLDFWDMRIRQDFDSRRVTLERLDVISIVSAQPWQGVTQPISWRLKLGTQQRTSCYGRDQSCFLTGVSAGAGLSGGDKDGRVVGYILPGADVGYSDEKDMTLFGGPSGLLGLVWAPVTPVRLGVSAMGVRRLGIGGAALTDWNTMFEAAWSPAINLEVRAGLGHGTLAHEKRTTEGKLSFYLYYE